MRDSDATPVRLTLVAEDPLARGALSRAVSEQGSDVVVTASGTRVEVESSSPQAAADVVLWDVGLHPTGSGGQLDAPDLGAPVLALVPDESAGEGALSAGARGCSSGTWLPPRCSPRCEPWREDSPCSTRPSPRCAPHRAPRRPPRRPRA
ncbi:hypothetical protein ACN28S_20985 [Cystobacter fuscus]